MADLGAGRDLHAAAGAIHGEDPLQDEQQPAKPPAAAQTVYGHFRDRPHHFEHFAATLAVERTEVDKIDVTRPGATAAATPSRAPYRHRRTDRRRVRARGAGARPGQGRCACPTSRLIPGCAPPVRPGHHLAPGRPGLRGIREDGHPIVAWPEPTSPGFSRATGSRRPRQSASCCAPTTRPDSRRRRGGPVVTGHWRRHAKHLSARDVLFADQRLR